MILTDGGQIPEISSVFILQGVQEDISVGFVLCCIHSGNFFITCQQCRQCTNEPQNEERTCLQDPSKPRAPGKKQSWHGHQEITPTSLLGIFFSLLNTGICFRERSAFYRQIELKKQEAYCFLPKGFTVNQKINFSYWPQFYFSKEISHQ